MTQHVALIIILIAALASFGWAAFAETQPKRVNLIALGLTLCTLVALIRFWHTL
jgi:hypothetical protein